MIDAKQCSGVALQDLQRIEGRFIDEAHSVWDKLDGRVCSYKDFMRLYIELKWSNWYNEIGRN